MALLEKETNNYYRIDFDSCSVRGRKVFISFSTYKTENDRVKEKVRGEAWSKFQRDLRAEINGLHLSLIADAKKATAEKAIPSVIAPHLQGLPDEEKFIAAKMQVDENGKINEAEYPKLRAAQDELNELEFYEHQIPPLRYEFDGQRKQLSIPEHIERRLMELGFDTAWITDPIQIVAGAEVCAGDYNDEPISHELFYERLKALMGEVTDC